MPQRRLVKVKRSRGDPGHEETPPLVQCSALVEIHIKNNIVGQQLTQAEMTKKAAQFVDFHPEIIEMSNASFKSLLELQPQSLADAKKKVRTSKAERSQAERVTPDIIASRFNQFIELEKAEMIQEGAKEVREQKRTDIDNFVNTHMKMMPHDVKRIELEKKTFMNAWNLDLYLSYIFEAVEAKKKLEVADLEDKLKLAKASLESFQTNQIGHTKAALQVWESTNDCFKFADAAPGSFIKFIKCANEDGGLKDADLELLRGLPSLTPFASKVLQKLMGADCFDLESVARSLGECTSSSSSRLTVKQAIAKVNEEALSTSSNAAPAPSASENAAGPIPPVVGAMNLDDRSLDLTYASAFDMSLSSHGDQARANDRGMDP